MSNGPDLMSASIPSTPVSMKEKLQELATLLSYRENIRSGQFSVLQESTLLFGPTEALLPCT